MDIRELILSTAPARSPKVEAVDTGEWGTMHVRVMSGTERDAYDATLYRDWDEETERWIRPPNLRSHLLVRTICDTKGVRVFTDDDVAKLGEADHRLLTPLYVKSMEINRIGGGAVEEEKKDSGAIPTSSSGTNSPSNSDAP
jgi:hypothetical protein